MGTRNETDIAEGRGITNSSGAAGFAVVANDAGQHAVWPADLPLPAGWRPRSGAMPAGAAAAAAAAWWPDITPAAARAGDAGAPPAVRMPHPGHGRYVHDQVSAQAARRPDAIAIVCGRARMTYGQLDRSAERLAGLLRDMGAGPETLVGVCVERGPGAIRGLLAVLRSGAAYLPLDPSHPAARLAELCETAHPALILASRADAALLPRTGARVLVTGAPSPAGRTAGEPGPIAALHPDNLAYTIHTSGSTGHPKIVAVSHGSLACVISDLSRHYRISPADRVLQLASLGFDTSLEQIFVTLTAGATLMLPAAGIPAPADLLDYLAGMQVTVADLTPAYWHQLLAMARPGDERLRSIRLMITGGEAAQPADCEAALRAAPAATLLNAYGLTETTITSALADVAEDLSRGQAPGRIAVGRPLPHAQILVLDPRLAPVPAGAVGEIYIGGCGVARGFLGQPALTARRFLPNPYGPVPGGRMYRTGDLGRWRAGQCLEFIGRTDRRLKVRGFRVEPGEIEAALTRHPGVHDAAVVARDTIPGHRQLVAYYTRPAGPARDAAPGAGLREYLAARLPGFMVPGLFVEVARIPRASDGTADRSALPDPLTTASGPDGHLRTPAEAGLAHVWSRILDTGPVGPGDDFFLLGGDSLRAAEMLADARVMFGVSPDRIRPLTRCLLREPTLRGFARAVQAARSGTLTEGAGQHLDVAREARLTDAIHRHAGPPPRWRRPREVLLTGATGFLGSHLLRELLASTRARIHCLVRADDAAHARQRIAQTAARYEMGDLGGGRVVAVPGDLAEPGLGLPAGEFRSLAQSVDVIYHAGAVVNFIYPYEELRAANVFGTQELIRLAGLSRGIPVHYISSTAVLAGFGAAGVREVTEDTPLAHAGQLCVGYLETKFVAEEMLRNAARAGLPVTIYRPLDIAGDQRTGAWNTGTEMCALIKFITDAGAAPDIDLPLDFVPADTCAAAIVYIAGHRAAAGHTYHLASQRRAELGSLVGRLRTRGFAIRVIPYPEWVAELLRYAADHPGHPMTAFVPLFVDRCPGTALTVAEMYLGHIFPSYARSRTEHALRGSGIVFPAVGGRLLDLTIDRLIATGYLRDPGAADVPPHRGHDRRRD